MLLVSLMSLAGYSQTITLNKAGDTTICFTLSQSKFILKKIYQASEYQKLDSICEQQLSVYQLEILDYKKVQYNQSLIIKNGNELANLKDIKIDILTKQISEEKKKTRIQKFYKVGAMVAGGALSGYLGFKLITK